MEKTLNLQSQYGGEIKVSLEINTYLNNGWPFRVDSGIGGFGLLYLCSVKI